MRKPKTLIYCADFETTSLAQYQVEGCTRVYLWKIMGVRLTWVLRERIRQPCLRTTRRGR